MSESRLSTLGDLANHFQGKNSTPSTDIPVLTVDDETDNRFWGVSDRDVPILIGAAAGSVGLVFLILAAIVIWYCCQFVCRQEAKSMYSLDYDIDDSDRGSLDSDGTQPFSDSAYLASSAPSKSVAKEDIKRSQSTPLNVNKLGLMMSNPTTNTSLSSSVGSGCVSHSTIKSSTLGRHRKEGGVPSSSSSHHHHRHHPHRSTAGSTPSRDLTISGRAVDYLVTRGQSSTDNPLNRQTPKRNFSKNSGYLLETSILEPYHFQATNWSRSYYPSTVSQLVDSTLPASASFTTSGQQEMSSSAAEKRNIFHLNPSRSSHPFTTITVSSADDDDGPEVGGSSSKVPDPPERVHFTKKRKNRMLRDSATAIAMTKMTDMTPLFDFTDTQQLISSLHQDSVVVYNERTQV